jgi:hypothetical protein
MLAKWLLGHYFALKQESTAHADMRRTTAQQRQQRAASMPPLVHQRMSCVIPTDGRGSYTLERNLLELRQATCSLAAASRARQEGATMLTQAVV